MSANFFEIGSSYDHATEEQHPGKSFHIGTKRKKEQEKKPVAPERDYVLLSQLKGRTPNKRQDLPGKTKKEPLVPAFNYHAYAEKIAGEGLALSVDPVCQNNHEIARKVEISYQSTERTIKGIGKLKDLKGEWSKKEKEIGLVAMAHLSVGNTIRNMKEVHKITNIPALLETEAALENHWQALKKVVDMSQFQTDKPEAGH